MFSLPRQFLVALSLECKCDPELGIALSSDSDPELKRQICRNCNLFLIAGQTAHFRVQGLCLFCLQRELTCLRQGQTYESQMPGLQAQLQAEYGQDLLSHMSAFDSNKQWPMDACWSTRNTSTSTSTATCLILSLISLTYSWTRTTRVSKNGSIKRFLFLHLAF